jgi:hypothetical protein
VLNYPVRAFMLRVAYASELDTIDLLPQPHPGVFKDAAIQFVPCPNIPYRAVGMFCDRAALVAGPLQSRCPHKRGIRLLLRSLLP